VRYPFEELYAVLCIESRRARTRLVGEDMGTVPAAVRRTMAAHGLLRIYAVQTELGAGDPFDRVPSEAMVGMNTHDMSTFARFWDDEGAADGRRDALRAALERRGHAVADGPGALDACLLELAGSDASAELVSLEDMWWEREPQNVPGTTTAQPNWRRLARHAVEELDDVPGLAPRLRRVAAARSHAR
jgi:4-alpha-glucanotransferase